MRPTQSRSLTTRPIQTRALAKPPLCLHVLVRTHVTWQRTWRCRYQWRKDSGAWTLEYMNTTAGPTEELGGEGVKLAWAASVGHTAVRRAHRLHVSDRTLTLRCRPGHVVHVRCVRKLGRGW